MEKKALLSISGSAGMGLADSCGVPFVQEVFYPGGGQALPAGTDCVIELGGEDAKILSLQGNRGADERQLCRRHWCFHRPDGHLAQDVCPGDEHRRRTGAAHLHHCFPLRCVRKSDVQPLINQGARTEDIAASIYKAVVNQTIAGLAQGRPIRGNVLYLGGPLTFSSVLRKSFDEALGVTGLCPENSLLYVSLGAALYADQEFCLADVAKALDQYAATATYASEPRCLPIKKNTRRSTPGICPTACPMCPLLHSAGRCISASTPGPRPSNWWWWTARNGSCTPTTSPTWAIRCPLIRSSCSSSTKAPRPAGGQCYYNGLRRGSGKNAFRCDYGLVETVAHFTAAKYFMPDVDFIIDIGGQDMKCFKIEDGAISNIF